MEEKLILKYFSYDPNIHDKLTIMMNEYKVKLSEEMAIKNKKMSNTIEFCKECFEKDGYSQFSLAIQRCNKSLKEDTI